MLIWEDLTPAQKRAIKEVSQVSFEKMIRIWFFREKILQL